jgi:histidine triad (HIT) family protein
LIEELKPMLAYDDTNVFARILRGELPCYKLYEDDATLAFMDVMPRADGHALVIPKAPARTLLDLNSDLFGPLMTTVQRVSHAVMIALSAEGLTIQQFNESAGGQVVFHLHVHILPRWKDVPLRPHTGIMANPEELAATRDLIAAELGRFST